MSDVADEGAPTAKAARGAEHAFLIADVRGYTAFTREHGDAAAARLALVFAQIAREAVAARGGRVIELRGDEALAVFDSSRQAVIAALEMQQAMVERHAQDPTLPLRVGIGIDVGEAIPVEGGYRGRALNLCARLCSRAGPGEVLASQHAVTLARALPDVDYAPLGALELKGFDVPVQAVHVTGPPTEDPALAPERSKRPLPSALDPSSGLLAGRDHELDWLRGSWWLARRGRGRVLFITSAVGLGRTRLAAELALQIHREGASVLYASAADEPEVLAAIDVARQVAAPTLLVLDDLEVAGPAVVDAVASLPTVVRDRPLLALCLFVEDSAPVELMGMALRADGAGDALCRLRALDVEAVARIAALYTGSGPPLAAPAVHAATDGIPGRVHEVAAEWSVEEARERLGRAAERVRGERGPARATETHLSETVLQLQRANEQARVFAADHDSAGPGVAPFKGLAAFESADAQDFFGRERLVAELMAHLVGSRLVAVVGPSGSGKSSAVRAGLLPALAAGMLPGGERWQQRIMRPAEHPLRALDEALAEPGEDGLVIFVDQFEELFTSAADADEQAAFVQRLVDIVVGEDSDVRVVLALRADYYGHCAAYPQLADLLGDSHVLVGAMREDELRRVIDLPARRAGLRIEAELTDALVSDVVAEPGGLPLLSTALLELWQLRDGRHMRLEHYEATGGVHGAVGRLAETAFEHLTADQQAAARRVLLRLAGVGEGDAVVRRRAPLDEFEVDRDADGATVLEVFTRDRLLTTSDGTVEVSHEALFREWPRLTAWLAEDAQGRVLHASLSDAARDWASRGRDASELYRGARLDSAQEWAAEHPDQLNDLEREFLQHSQHAGQQELRRARRTNRRLRSLLVGVAVLLALSVVAAVVALDERDGARRAALVSDAQRLGAEGLTETTVDRSLLMARQGLALHDSVRTRGNLLSALMQVPAATKVYYGRSQDLQDLAVSPDGRQLALAGDSKTLTLVDTRSGKETGPPIRMLDSLGVVAFSPDGRTIAVGDGGNLALFDAQTHKLRARLGGRPKESVSLSGEMAPSPIADIRFSPHGRSLIAVARNDDTDDAEGALFLYVLRGRRWVLTATRPGELVRYFPDGERIVGESPTGEFLELWDAHTLTTLRKLRHIPPGSYPGEVATDGSLPIEYNLTVRLANIFDRRPPRFFGQGSTPDLTPDGRLLVAPGGDSNEMPVWDRAAGRPRESIKMLTPTAGAHAVSPDSRTLYTSAPSGRTIAWDLTRSRRVYRQAPQRFTTPDAPTQAWAVSPDSANVVTVQPDGTIRRRDAVSLRSSVIGRLPSRLRGVLSVVVIPGQRTLALLRFDGVVLWSLRDHRVTRRIKDQLNRRGCCDAAVAPDGRTLIAGQFPSRVLKRWDLRRGSALPALTMTAPVHNVAFAPDGRSFAVGLKDGEVEIYDTRSARRRLRWRADVSDVTPTYSPDGRIVATGGYSGAPKLWRARTGKPIGRPLTGFSNGAWQLTFSPDGRTLASSGFDGTTLLHDIATRRLIGPPLPGPNKVAAAPYFTPDGKRMVVYYTNDIVVRVGAIHQVRSWDVSPTLWARRACAVAGRTLTRSEWKQLLPNRDYRPACSADRP